MGSLGNASATLARRSGDGMPLRLDYPTMTWAMFAVMFATAPALVFLIQVFLVVPPLFILAGILDMIPKAIEPAQAAETLTFMAIFAVHLLVFSGFYLNLARGLAKLIGLIGNARTRCAAFMLTLAAAASVSALPVYGFGGHSRAAWGPLWLVFEKVNESHGRYGVLAVYGAFGISLLAWVLYRRFRRSALHISGPPADNGG